MTCIVGFAKEGKVYIGGDSAGVSGLSISIRSDEKVFRIGPFIMGFTSSFRMGQLLRYCFDCPAHPEGVDDMTYMVRHFIPAVKTCFKEGGYGTISSETKKPAGDEGGRFMVGYNGNLYVIHGDFQVGKITDNIASVGCGDEVALGAMYGLSHLYPRERILKALEITTHLNAGVRPPFIVEES